MVVPTKTERRFVLTLHPNSEGNDWGMTLVETSGGHSQVIADLAVPRASIYRRHVCDAVTDAGYQRTAVSPRRKKPFNLTQEPGVRLALMVLALGPVSNPVVLNFSKHSSCSSQANGTFDKVTSNKA